MDINLTKLTQRRFHNQRQETVIYHGEPVEWRISAYGLAIQNDKILLGLNKQDKYYDLPGGGIELGETPEEALIREGLEETGYQLQPDHLIAQDSDWIQRPTGEFCQTLRLYFSASQCLHHGEPTDPEMTEIVWASWSEIDTNCYPVDDFVREVIKSAFLA